MHKVEVDVSEDLLEVNRNLAREVRETLDEHNVRAVEVLGSIGSGKTSLIEWIVKEYGDEYSFAVIAGDVVSEYDERRFKDLGVPTVGLNTGRECHLDAHMVQHGLEHLEELTDLNEVDVLFIENVGNLVCPADFPIGAHLRVIVVSATEGEDVIGKHPMMIRKGDVLVVNKIDLADACGVSPETMVRTAKEINPDLEVYLTSIKTGEGMAELAERLLP
ncbi:hydrogenase nickel incorporation protein HypB [Methanopyrus kandleri]|uniref:Ni2+-binding GTPase involved in regulation of expression and maturation of hydrogenase n=2 Tax=Methanopyrus kandleri TaxID=2320 RepID=Q8TV54_METKA|nr:hydrogenase nickel incorporation protein HypB [Methanopyrus kandleri]AAM02759.1 Ni2+-binding GTPase involved in regulation of expression and maturation of hydrogenase [Methanopyrus kandleri AV19]HII71019.1 hydrogenase nickel incorporation protein HypB [Methanopyrus kandleri]